MGNGWSANAQAEGKQTVNKRGPCDWYPGVVLSPLPNHFSKSSPEFPPNSTFPEFKPTLFLTDICTNDVNLNNPEKKKNKISKSRLYIYGPDNARYVMQFRVANPKFAFVYAKDRPAVEAQRTRSTQVYTAEKFVRVGSGGINCKFYKKAFVSTTHPPERKAQQPRVTCDENLLSQIFIEKDDVEFLLSIKGDLTVAAQFKYEAAFNYLGVCRASLLMKVDSAGDICRVCFDLTDLDFANISVKTSRGCQTADPYTYYRTRGSLNSVMYVPVPISTYSYKDPMADIRTHNHRQVQRGVDPEWMTEVRRERLCRPEKMKPDSRYSGSLVSNFIVERGGYIFKACTGLLRAKLIRGYPLYDEFVRAHFSENEKFPEKFWMLTDISSLLEN